MSSRRAQVDSLTDDVSTLSEKVAQLYDDLEATVELIEADAGDAGAEGRNTESRNVEPQNAESPNAEASGADGQGAEAGADGGHVGWKEVETARPDGEADAESVAWAPVEDA